VLELLDFSGELAFELFDHQNRRGQKNGSARLGAGRRPSGISLYPEPETTSRPEQAAPRSRGVTRTLTLAVAWTAGIVVFVTAAAYAVLGRDFLRPLVRLRARAATRLETALTPPSQAEVAAARARAATDTASAQLTERADAASPEFIVAFLGAILFAAFAAFYLTGRRRRVSR
jgi:hypothetical protein